MARAKRNARKPTKTAPTKSASKKKAAVAEPTAAPADASADNRTVIYNQTSNDDDWNIVYEQVGLMFHGKPLLAETSIRLLYGERYALVGSNGCGKTTLLRALASGDFSFPKNYDIFLLEHEYPASDETPMEAVICDVDAEIDRLSEQLVLLADDPEADEDTMQLIESRLELLTADAPEARAGRILAGLGFSAEDAQNKPTRELSGGWRMRVALARALYLQPALLLLDSPTSHLDLDSVLWLERALTSYSGTIVLTSHSADFLDNVASAVVLMREQKLHFFNGNFSSYLVQRDNLDARTARLYAKQQRDIAKYQAFITRYGQSSKQLSRQAQSRQKRLDRMMDTAVSATLLHDKEVDIDFVDPRPLPPPLVAFRDVAFKYPTMEHLLYEDVNLGISPGDVVFIVGANGSGKSTLMKLVRGVLSPLAGDIRTHTHCRVSTYHQHFRDELPGDMTPLDFFKKKFPAIVNEQDLRKMLGRFGIVGEHQTVPISSLSDGCRVRIALSLVSYDEPTLLLLDEPTNNMDLATVDGLARGLRRFKGAVMVVTHDFRLISQVADGLEPGMDKRVYIWNVDHIHRSVTVWKGDIMEYKQLLLEEVMERVGGC